MPSDRDRPCPMTPRDRLIEAAAESLFQLAYLPSTYWRPEWDDVDGGAKDYNRAKAGQVLDALTASPELAGVLARWAAGEAGGNFTPHGQTRNQRAHRVVSYSPEPAGEDRVSE